MLRRKKDFLTSYQTSRLFCSKIRARKPPSPIVNNYNVKNDKQFSVNGTDLCLEQPPRSSSTPRTRPMNSSTWQKRPPPWRMPARTQDDSPSPPPPLCASSVTATWSFRSDDVIANSLNSVLSLLHTVLYIPLPTTKKKDPEDLC